MGLSAFAIATQGVGPDPMLTAVQGFYESADARQQLIDDFLYGGGDGRTRTYERPTPTVHVPQLPKQKGTVVFGTSYGMLSAAPPFVVALERHKAIAKLSAAHGTLVSAEFSVSAKDWRDNDDGMIAILSTFFD